MCSLCGVLDEEHWTEGAGGDTASAEAARRQTRRQERQHRIALTNRILRAYSLKLAAWSGSGYVLSSRTGRSEIVPNLAALWPAAERLSGRRCDPLDSDLLAALGGSGAG